MKIKYISGNTKPTESFLHYIKYKTLVQVEEELRLRQKIKSVPRQTNGFKWI